MAVVARHHERVEAVGWKIDVGKELNREVGFGGGAVVTAARHGADAEINKVIVGEEHALGGRGAAGRFEVNRPGPGKEAAVCGPTVVGDVCAMEADKLLLDIAGGCTAMLVALMRG